MGRGRRRNNNEENSSQVCCNILGERQRAWTRDVGGSEHGRGEGMGDDFWWYI